MNLTSYDLKEKLCQLEKSLTTISPNQRKILDSLYNKIKEEGRYYNVPSAALTIEDMREHGYDVTEEDSLVIEQIANKVQVDADMLWNGIEIWANVYGVKDIDL